MNKGLLAAILAAVLVVAGGLLTIWKFQPTMEVQKQQVLEGAFREGTPEFEALTKKLIIENDEENTFESPLGIGTIMMSIAGEVRNYSDKTVTGLEIKVSVLDSFGKVVKSETEAVIPIQQAKLEPKQEMKVTIRIDGFEQKDDRARVQWKVTAIKTE